LIQNDAYDAMKKLTNLWIKRGFNTLVDEIISCIHTLIERIDSNELEVESYYYYRISSSVHAPVIENFFAIEIEALGDCLYYAVPNSLMRNGPLSTAGISNGTKIIEFQSSLKNKVRRCFYDAL
jgi:hypothetical protein